ncbi:unnamed protein product [Thlaspi arvense]|uniref:Disease resistance RPP13-like protein 1 n=1 Tax=Thlaspi arvense TaxID=13288 RepID=A0AAU9T6I7_THLAR|nr:unnamed protein product [Thlaspi arvense]
MAIAEIVISAFVSLLFKKMASVDLLNFVRQEGIEDQFKKWRRTLSKIQADLAYDLDDLVDEFSTEVLRRKLTADPPARTSKVWNAIPTCCTNLKPTTILFNAQMKSKIESITSRLNDSFNQSVDLKLEKIVGTISGQTWRRRETTSIMHETQVYGREQDEKRLIEMLRQNDSSQGKVGVIPLVGMGGVGKTTLARMAYNDPIVMKAFDLKAWAYVSDEFDIMRITKVILESVTSQSCVFTSLDKVQGELKNALTGKKFLIVLDDIWNKNHGDWIALKSPFNHGAQGSKVLVTTRNRDIAKMMGTVKFQEVSLLSPEDCWLLFAQYAFENNSMNANPKLVSIGKQIVEKCGGLPLAARTIGGLLRRKEQEEEWEVVLNSNIWNLSKDENDIVPAIRLSYHYLPPHLKQCFAYCAILPKDYEFDEKELILLWMAEGFIQQQTEQDQLEDIGAFYFQELVSMSFFQLSNSTISKFVMHDLINDLACEVGRKSCFRLEGILKDGEQHRNLMKARYASYMQGHHDGMDKFKTFYHAENLRTFLPFSLNNEYCYLRRSVPSDLLPKLSYLRELSLRKYKIKEIPSSIGNLKHLRYIDLSCSRIESLPDSFGDLYNLQTLNLEGCNYLNKISMYMGKLTKLRHLSLPSSLKEMPLGIGKLTSLQTLSHFIITKGNGSRIKELGDLNHLGGALCVSGLENIVNVEDVRKANLKNKLRLSKLSLLWSETSDELQDQSVRAKVFDVLQPPKNLRELLISGYHGRSFPYWMGDPVFSSMETVSLESCRNCTCLPQLGRLPVLKKVFIKGMVAVQCVGREFYGQDFAKPFPLLEELSFVDMQEWEDWQTGEDAMGVQPFACVSELVIKNCPNLLRKLPGNLPCLETLMIEKCPQLQVEASKLNYPSLTSLSMKDVPLPILSIDVMAKVLGHNSLASLDIGGFPVPNFFSNPSRDDEIILESTVCKHLSVGTNLEIENVQKLAFLPKWFTQVLTKVEKLSIRKCDGLLTLWKNNGRLAHSLQGLRHLKIESCSLLVSLFEGKEYESKRQEQQQLDVLLGLEVLLISECEKLETLPQGLHNFMSLRELTICRCHNLVNFPVHGFPCTLRKLYIVKCDALKWLPGWNNLEDLQVEHCKSLEYLIPSSARLPSTLRHIRIGDCEKMLALLREEEGLVSFPCLEYFALIDCGSLKFLPDANLDNIMTKLLLSDLLSNAELTSLECLHIKGGIEVSFLMEKNNFLSNLTVLSLDKVNTRMPPSEWGLHTLSSLETLRLIGPIVIEESETKQMEVDKKWTSFPFHGMLLPTSLTTLVIRYFNNLEALSPQFQQLTSLEWLYIEKCPMLSYFPKQGLPCTLLMLWIVDCAKLGVMCQKGKGKYWPLIHLIPEVRVEQ